MRTTSSKPLLVLIPLIVLCGLVVVTASSLTKDDVLRMAREGQSEQALIDAVHGSQASFDLTADDIAELRQAGVSQQVIDAMIETHEHPRQDVEYDGPEDEEDVEQAPVEVEPTYEYYPAPPVYYPIYPIYSPVYYPVYDPFFSFFGGFSFSFAFVHPFGFHAVFPCDRSFVVVRNTTGFHTGATALVRNHPVTFTTARHDRGWNAPVTSRGARIRGNTTFRPPGTQSLAPRPNSYSRLDPVGPGRSSETPSRRSFAAPRYGPAGPSYEPRHPAPQRYGTPRPFVGSPRNQMPPRFPATPRFEPGPRRAAPRFGGGPSFRAPSAPRAMPMPRGGFSSGGRMQGPSGGGNGGGAVRSGGGRGRGGHH